MKPNPPPLPEEITLALTDFSGGYIEALYALETGIDHDIPEGAALSDVALTAIRDDCRAFLAEGLPLLPTQPCAANNPTVETVCQAGTDFFLTRNGHGAGFWDRPEVYGGQENADALTDLAHSFGEVWSYLGDDGLIYVTPTQRKEKVTA